MNGPLNNPAMGQASRSREKRKKLPAHVDWREKKGVISKVKDQVNFRQSRQKCPCGCNLRTPRWQFQRSVTLECPVCTIKWQGFHVQLFLIHAFTSEHQTKM